MTASNPPAPEYSHYPGLTDREVATALASLRRRQDEIGLDAGRAAAEPMPMHFEDYEPLTVAEIDQLCERTNSGGYY